MPRSNFLDHPPHPLPTNDYRKVLEALRFWPMKEEDALRDFLFNMGLLIGSPITGDYEELSVLLSYGASALRLYQRRLHDAYLHASRHLAIEFGRNGPIPARH